MRIGWWDGGILSGIVVEWTAYEKLPSYFGRTTKSVNQEHGGT